MHVLPALLSTLGFGISNGLGRTLARIHPVTGLVLRGVPIVVFLAVLLVVYGAPVPSVRGVLITVLIGCIGYVPIWALYRGLAVADVGVVMPLAYINPAVTTVLATVVSGAVISLVGYVSIVLLLLGALLVSYTHGVSYARAGVWYGLVAGCGWGVTFFLFQYPVALVGPLLATCIVEVCVVIIAIAERHARHMPVAFCASARMAGWGFVAFLGFGAFVGSYGFMVSASQIGVAYSAAIGSASPVIASLVSVFYYSERYTVQKGAALVCTVLGIVGIALG